MRPTTDQHHELFDDDGDSELAAFHDLLRRSQEYHFPDEKRRHIGAVIEEAAGTSPPAMQSPGGRSHHRWQWLVRRPQFLVLTLMALVISTGAVFGAGNILDLGRPTNTLSTNAYFPLSGFHRVSTSLQQGKKPELLFLGVDEDIPAIAIERWPVIKALSQFGQLSGITAIDSQCSAVQGGPPNSSPNCTLPTYDFSHVRFHSPYLAFVSRDLIRFRGNKQVIDQRLSAAEMKIFVRYARTKQTPECLRNDSSGHPIKSANGQLETYPCTSLVDYVGATLNDQNERTLPLLLIGNYLQTVTQDVNSGDFSQSIELTPPSSAFPAYGYQRPFSFDTIRSALGSGRNPGTTSSHLVQDVNAEANVITALICHADGRKPKSVCGRAVIKKILKHVK